MSVKGFGLCRDKSFEFYYIYMILKSSILRLLNIVLSEVLILLFRLKILSTLRILRGMLRLFTAFVLGALLREYLLHSLEIRLR